MENGAVINKKNKISAKQQNISMKSTDLKLTILKIKYSSIELNNKLEVNKVRFDNRSGEQVERKKNRASVTCGTIPKTSNM